MTTISVPITAHIEESINSLIESGYGSNKADVVRKAIIRLAEEEAVSAVLRAQQEPTIHGDLKELAEKFK